MCSTSLAELQVRAWQIAEDKGWHEPALNQPPTTVGDRLALIHSEVSEALEAFRQQGDPTVDWFSPGGKPEGVPAEIADVVIRCLDFAGIYGIDLEKAVLEKLRYNEGREWRHGGKVL